MFTLFERMTISRRSGSLPLHFQTRQIWERYGIRTRKKPRFRDTTRSFLSIFEISSMQSGAAARKKCLDQQELTVATSSTTCCEGCDCVQKMVFPIGRVVCYQPLVVESASWVYAYLTTWLWVNPCTPGSLSSSGLAHIPAQRQDRQGVTAVPDVSVETNQESENHRYYRAITVITI